MVFLMDATWNLWDYFRILFESLGIVSWVPCDSFGIQFGWHGIVSGSYTDRMGLGWVVSLPLHPLQPESPRLGGEGMGHEWGVDGEWAQPIGQSKFY